MSNAGTLRTVLETAVAAARAASPSATVHALHDTVHITVDHAGHAKAIAAAKRAVASALDGCGRKMHHASIQGQRIWRLRESAEVRGGVRFEISDDERRSIALGAGIAIC